MYRRSFLTMGTSLFVAIAGCAGGPNEPAEGGTTTTSTETDTRTESATSEPTSTETATPTESPTATGTSTPNYQVRISYEGEWSGTIGGDGSSRSVDGSGTETFDVQGDPFIVSANAQKRDQGSGTLTLQILENGEVIAQRATSAEYGVVQVTSDGGVQTESDDDSGTSETTFEVRISYSGEWQGSLGEDGSIQSVDGSGTRTFTVDGEPSVISANAQKQDDSSETLTVQILKDGEVVKEASTSAEYGVAQVSYSNF